MLTIESHIPQNKVFVATILNYYWLIRICGLDQAWWHKSIILLLGRLKEKDGELKASLGDPVSSTAAKITLRCCLKSLKQPNYIQALSTFHSQAVSQEDGHQ